MKQKVLHYPLPSNHHHRTPFLSSSTTTIITNIIVKIPIISGSGCSRNGSNRRGCHFQLLPTGLIYVTTVIVIVFFAKSSSYQSTLRFSSHLLEVLSKHNRQLLASTPYPGIFMFNIIFLMYADGFAENFSFLSHACTQSPIIVSPLASLPLTHPWLHFDTPLAPL